MRKWIMTTAIIGGISLSACGQADTTEEQPKQQHDMNHESMNHSSSEGAPDAVKKEKNPKFSVGSKVIMEAHHMPGMDGQQATVSGAYDTTVYSVTYTPTTGKKEPVKNHKWVIHEEIKKASPTSYKKGDKVTLTADHMEGMAGARATIDSAKKTTVYMVDYKDADGQMIKNHKWVTENELRAAH
ncbi:hypothetical protein QI30_02875 [Kurthia sp. 3B1D]|uniref:DUF1541 domain-containing protein n=1 Tax=Candidatus Kurthia intestinigallinarum TaxID=1562256 RepID=A0A433RXV0_9BACL|nr:YdhK family protein [Kurthia sp. 3B1D]RUS58105.1 hypothetical protein QI30_02875 [Kurthia sp. 3B1D]